MKETCIYSFFVPIQIGLIWFLLGAFSYEQFRCQNEQSWKKYFWIPFMYSGCNEMK